MKYKYPLDALHKDIAKSSKALIWFSCTDKVSAT